jgi:hypothetical protein
MIDSENLRYSCGHFCCSWSEVLPSWLHCDVILEGIQDAVKRMELYCPGCQLDREYERARHGSAHLGLKRLIGEPATVQLAEVVRYHIYLMLWSDAPVAQACLRSLFGQPFARQGRLWVNYRDALWNASRRDELLVALREGGLVCSR